jgi:hypothetical protein
MKTLKRTMAGEYSRELGVKVLLPSSDDVKLCSRKHAHEQRDRPIANRGNPK